MLRTLPLLILLLATCSNDASPDPVMNEDKAATITRSDTTQLAEYVVGAFEDSQGGLWFGTINSGVAHVVDGRLTFIDSTQGLPPNGGHGLVEAPDGTLWIAGHDGVFLHDPARPGPLQVLHRSGATVRTDRSGHVWVSTQGKVFRYTDARTPVEFAVPLPEQPPAAYSIDPRKLVFLLEDSRGRRWFGTDGHGAICWDPEVAARGTGDPFTRFTQQDGLCSNTPWSIVEDREGRIWFACIQAFQPRETGDGGLCVLQQDGTIRTFPDLPGLHHNDLYTLYVDRDGALWSSAYQHGVYRHYNGRFTLFNTTDRPDLNGNFGLQAMLQDRRGRYWMGFSGGLFTLEGDRLVHVPRGGPWE